MILDAINRRRKLAGAAANQIQEHQLRGGEKPARFRIRLRRENSGANDHVRLVERGGGFEFATVKSERDFQIIGREMRGEGKGKPKLRGEPRAKIARAEQIERDVQAGAGNRLDGLARFGGRK